MEWKLRQECRGFFISIEKLSGIQDAVWIEGVFGRAVDGEGDIAEGMSDPRLLGLAPLYQAAKSSASSSSQSSPKAACEQPFVLSSIREKSVGRYPNLYPCHPSPGVLRSAHAVQQLRTWK